MFCQLRETRQVGTAIAQGRDQVSILPELTAAKFAAEDSEPAPDDVGPLDAGQLRC